MPRKRRTAAEAASSETDLGEIRVGTAGWSYQDWNGVVYPAHRGAGFHEAAYLAEFFDTIEINTSFYQPMRPQLAEQWVTRVAANPRFQFTAKLWQRFTHEGGGATEDERAVKEGFAPLVAAGKLAAVLLQFPFSFHHTPENVDTLKSLFDRFGEYSLAVEVRHASWKDPKFFALLHKRGVGFCNIDQPLIGRSLEPMDRATAAIGYVRLHGRRYDAWFSGDPETPPEERYNYLYSEEELDPWAGRIRNVAKHSRATYVIANNHYLGKGAVNGLQLISILKNAKVKVPETLREHYPELNKIADAPETEPTLFPNPRE
ncbi:MAG TPA: DUF72 domain-containing protein [Candidatus Acidoferrales bacterium]|nr:DUF72 domain-containing protein [Candidatus Acidoferrales bacterium]